MKEDSSFFAPQLYLTEVAAAIEFYKKAFDAVELRKWNNDDGSVHVAELSINDALFHLHEETPATNKLSPQTLKGTTVVIGLFVQNPDSIMNKAIAAGAKETSAVQDYEYGYRQGTLVDPFGHHWIVQKKI